MFMGVPQKCPKTFLLALVERDVNSELVMSGFSYSTCMYYNLKEAGF